MEGQPCKHKKLAKTCFYKHCKNGACMTSLSERKTGPHGSWLGNRCSDWEQNGPNDWNDQYLSVPHVPANCRMAATKNFELRKLTATFNSTATNRCMASPFPGVPSRQATSVSRHGDDRPPGSAAATECEDTAWSVRWAPQGRMVSLLAGYALENSWPTLDHTWNQWDLETPNQWWNFSHLHQVLMAEHCWFQRTSMQYRCWEFTTWVLPRVWHQSCDFPLWNRNLLGNHLVNYLGSQMDLKILI